MTHICLYDVQWLETKSERGWSEKLRSFLSIIVTVCCQYSNIAVHIFSCSQIKRKLTWAMRVPIQMPMKIGFLRRPSKMLCWLWILRAFTSLNRVIMTKVLKIIVKWTDGGACTLFTSCTPSSMPSNGGPRQRESRMWMLNTILWKQDFTYSKQIGRQFTTSLWLDWHIKNKLQPQFGNLLQNSSRCRR